MSHICSLRSGWLGVKLGVGLLVVGQSMIFGLAINVHDEVTGDVRFAMHTLLLASTLLVMALLGGPLFSQAWRELRRGRITIEALFLVTITGAMGASLQAYTTGHRAIYFEVISVLLVVYTLGMEIGARGRDAAMGSVGETASCQTRADRLGRIFLPIVMATAVGTFLYWAFLSERGWESGLFNAMSVLLVACPCVIGLATPVVMAAARSRLAEHAVVVRDADAIEWLAVQAEMEFDAERLRNDGRVKLVEVNDEESREVWREAIAVSRDAVRAVKRNLWRAAAYNVIGMGLAATGVLHPIAAALLMVVSSLTLLFSATRAGCHAMSKNPPVATGGLGGVAAVHAVAFALQGLVLATLLDASAWLIVPFAMIGFALARWWQRSAEVPHTLDMAFGMLTVGNLGMLLGWWADLGFRPVHCLLCCACTDPLASPGMWLGMLIFGNVAMKWLGRGTRELERDHILAMFTGGNVGMLLGMAAGGYATDGWNFDSLVFVVMLHITGMTLGMIAGMLIGTSFVEALLHGLRESRSRVLPNEIIRGEAEADRDHGEAHVLGR
jgi:hypothetical protein